MKVTTSVSKARSGRIPPTDGPENVWHEFWKLRRDVNVPVIRARASLAQPEHAHSELLVETGSGHHLIVDDSCSGMGAQPIELVAAALAGCSASDLLAILRAKHQRVTAYEIRVETEQTERPPQVFVVARIHHVFTGHNIDAAIVNDAIRIAAEKSNIVETMLRCTAAIMTTFEIVEEPVKQNTAAGDCHHREQGSGIGK